MTFEMSCAKCEGRLLVETLGVVVACPHCGTHLSIPAEIPAPSDTPADSQDPSNGGNPSPFSHGTDQERKEPDDSNTKSTWVPDFMSDDSPSDFPDFSASSGADASTSESNVIVSEPESATETEVPSAIQVANPDPSGVMPAIVTGAPSAEPLSGFPVLVDPQNPSAPAEEAPQLESPPEEESQKSEAAAETSPDAEAGSNPVLPGSDGSSSAETVEDFPGIHLGQDDEPAESMPVIATETPASTDPIPAVTDASAAPAAPMIDAAPPKETSEKAGSSKENSDALKEKSNVPRKQSVYDSVFNSRRGKLIPPAVFQAWFSYTILVTFALIWAIYRMLTATASQLESLPDIKPLRKDVRIYVPPQNPMPPGHTLELNETQTFGKIKVTPLKVTRGPLEVEGGSPDGPVLKLYLKFKNVSQNQTIVPLDEELLFDRDTNPAEDQSGAIANQYVYKASEKKDKAKVVLVYGRLIGLDLDFKNQRLNTELEPGEEVSIYIPTETEGLDRLKGDLLWRVHFRKGHSPKNYGVTTVFEVKFHSDAIQNESANA